MADARTLMKRKGVPDRAIFVFGPGTKMSSKKWPIERYELLLTRLAAEHADAAFVVLGGPEDVDDGERLRAILPHRCYNLAGATSIGESAAVLSLAHLYIGNDTGTMHLAAAVGTKCIAIFSARDVANKWAPFGAGHQVIRKEVPCAGCLLENCVEMRGLCLTLISVDEVFERTNAALKDANDRVAEDPQ
jgi:ADP-heptose:LPS heptosyltransferase